MIRLFTLLLLSWVTVSAQAAEVVVWHAYRDAEEAGLKAAAQAWTAQTGTAVALQAVPFGAYDSKIETAIPRGNGPDLFIAGHANLGKWASMGVLEPVAPDDSGHRRDLVEALRWEGQRYGAPLTYKTLVLLYDPTVIDTPPETTDALIAMARQHTGDGRYGLAYEADAPYYNAPWMHGLGARAVGPDGVHLDSPEHVATFAFARRIGHEAGIVPPQPTYELVSRLYAQGQAAFVISGPWFVADTTRPIAAAPLPRLSETGEPARPYLTVEAAFVARGTAQPDQALALATFLAGPQGARIRQDIGGQAPSWRGLPTSNPLVRVLEQQSHNAVLLPTDPQVQAVFEAQARSLRRVMRGAVSPEQAADEAQTYYEVLSRPPPPPAPVWPYALVMGLAAAIGFGWLAVPLLEAEERRRIWSHRWDYVWVAPAFLAMSVLVVLPFLTGAAVSLFAHRGGEWTFVGFAHFADILLARDWPVSSPLSFVFTLGVTLLWTASNVTLHVALGVGLALVLREPWVRMRGVWRALLIIPWAVPNYITALIWKGMFHAQYGAINALIGLVVMRPVEIDWFGSFVTAFGANLATNTWLGFPFMMVVTLGALQSIPRDLEEAAEVDGASAWFRFRHVVWPLLQPALMPAIIIGSVWTFNMFNVIYLVSGGEPDSGTEILISEAYRWAFSRGNRYGYAAAYAVLIFGVLLVYSRAANRLAGRKVL